MKGGMELEVSAAVGEVPMAAQPPELAAELLEFPWRLFCLNSKCHTENLKRSYPRRDAPKVTAGLVGT